MAGCGARGCTCLTDWVGVGVGVIAHETLHRDVGGCLVSREETRRGLRSMKNYVCYSWLLQPGAVVPLCRL